MILWGIILIALGALAFVRIAPTEPEKWHQAIRGDADKNLTGGAVRVRPADDTTLARLDQIAQSTPRTRVLAGSVDEGRVTYETRTQWIGFPDYTTAEVENGQLKLYARLRFGRSDFGVNAKRLEAWLSKL